MTVQNAIALRPAMTSPRVRSETHFAEGFNFYKCFWIFLIGSFYGFVVETIFCLAKNGYLAYRSNILFTPLNTVYGLGALLLYICLYKIKNNIPLLFVVGTVAGTVVEYLCSWVQQMAFGSVSWDYSHLPLNINGRVCLLYSVFWGLLAIAWAKFLQPALDKSIAKIPDKIGRPLTWILFTSIAIVAVLTIVAVVRWNLRTNGIEASYQLTMWVDHRFPDTYMQNVFNNLKFVS